MTIPATEIDLRIRALFPEQIIKVGHYTCKFDEDHALQITQYGGAVGLTVSEAKKIWPRHDFFYDPLCPALVPIFEEEFKFLEDI